LPGHIPAQLARCPGREAGHLRAHLGHQHLRGPLANAGDGIQPGDRVGTGARPRRDRGADLLDARVEERQVVQLLGDQEALVRPDAASQGLAQRGQLLA
jgi:hypothetical protein